LKNLEKDFAGIEILKSDPVVQYKETVTKESSRICMTKSPNNHNRLYGVAVPLIEKLQDDIEKGII
jgi:elongation factor 2